MARSRVFATEQRRKREETKTKLAELTRDTCRVVFARALLPGLSFFVSVHTGSRSGAMDGLGFTRGLSFFGSVHTGGLWG